jgi:hypothetical protein
LSQKSLLKRNGQAFGKTDANKPTCGHCGAVADMAHGVDGCDDFAFGSRPRVVVGISHRVKVFL